MAWTISELEITQTDNDMLALTYSQDLVNHAVLGTGMLRPWLDLVVLLLSGGVFLMSAVWMHQRSRKSGY